MKVAITGHTKGLGKALKERFETAGHHVIGFCITTGYDISDAEVRDRIIAESADCDVFINNAYAPGSQHLLLESVYNQYADTEKMIINICSKIVDVDVTQHEEHDEGWGVYHRDKIRLQEFINDKCWVTHPHILNVLPGWMNTDMSSGREVPKMDVVDVADLIYYLFSLKDTLTVREIEILPKVKIF